MRRPSSAVRNHSANSSLVASGPSFSTGPVVVGREHPPPGLAFGAELAEQHRAIVGEPPPHDRTLRAASSSAAASKSSRPACERWNMMRRSLSKCSVTYFARRSTPTTAAPTSASGGGS